MPFRPEDEALVARLEEEALYARLYRAHAGQGAAPPPGRAAGLVHELRALPGAAEAFALALRDRRESPHGGGRSRQDGLDGLDKLMTAASFVDYPPPLLHHLALHFARIAAWREREVLHSWSPRDGASANAANAASSANAAAAANAVGYWELALSAFFALAAERGYVRAFVGRALGSSAKPADVERLAGALPFELVLRLGERAVHGARGLEPRARMALMALSRADSAARRAGASEELRQAIVAKAEVARARAIDEALAPVGQALDDATLANELTTRGIEVLHRTVAVWELSGQDEAVERFFVERAEPICWEIQRRREWDRFALLFGHDVGPYGVAAPTATFRLVESLVARVTADRGRVAYAAACAQFLVFYTNVATTLDRQIAIAERAVAVCPSHRNGRAVLASFLCQKARRNVEALVVSSSSLAEAESLVAKARGLFPSAREIDETAALVEAKRTSGLPRLP